MRPIKMSKKEYRRLERKLTKVEEPEIYKRLERIEKKVNEIVTRLENIWVKFLKEKMV